MLIFHFYCFTNLIQKFENHFPLIFWEHEASCFRFRLAEIVSSWQKGSGSNPSLNCQIMSTTTWSEAVLALRVHNSIHKSSKLNPSAFFPDLLGKFLKEWFCYCCTWWEILKLACLRLDKAQKSQFFFWKWNRERKKPLVECARDVFDFHIDDWMIHIDACSRAIPSNSYLEKGAGFCCEKWKCFASTPHKFA